MRSSPTAVRAGIRTGIVAAAGLWLAATILVGARGVPPAALPRRSPQAVPAPAPPPGTRSVLDGVFTDAQAKRGKDVYTGNCLQCHGDALQGGNEAPPLGPAFIASWKSATLGDMVEKIRRSMPDDAPGSLTAQQYTDVVTFILSASHYPTGATELPVETAQQKLIKVDPIK
jgi:mono/diheme cytochrome c family protein